MKKEKECYEVPRADIVDIRMEGSLLEGSIPEKQDQELEQLDPENY